MISLLTRPTKILISVAAPFCVAVPFLFGFPAQEKTIPDKITPKSDKLVQLPMRSPPMQQANEPFWHHWKDVIEYPIYEGALVSQSGAVSEVQPEEATQEQPDSPIRARRRDGSKEDGYHFDLCRRYNMHKVWYGRKWRCRH